MTNPEDFAQLQDRFAKILGRQPTTAEVKELMTDKDEMGLSYHDPLLIQLMAFKRERIGLEEVFRHHVAELGKQLGEARDQVLKETDQALVTKKTEILTASLKQMQTEMQAEQKRLMELHRTELTREVKATTKEALRGKFEESWTAEWAALMKQFSTDWNEKVIPTLGDLQAALHHAKTMAWFWFIAALLLSALIGTAVGVWWTNKHLAPLPADPSHQAEPAKPPLPKRK